MINSNNKKLEATYIAPMCEVIDTTPLNIICGSPDTPDDDYDKENPLTPLGLPLL